MRILITGGCGFIGSNFIKYILTNPEISSEHTIINIDKQTYAGKGKNIEHMSLTDNLKYKFIEADICDKKALDKIFAEQRPEIVFNFAAESHVDRSIENSENFIKSNINGAINVFEACLKYNVKRVVQISTDEVYGSIKEGSFSETDKLNPNSPYAASKASADIQALAYFKTHRLPVIITRSGNNYGPYQFPEKLLSLFITNLIDGKKVPLMWSEENPGLNIRDWLHVEDNCRAIWFAAMRGKEGEIYNIPGENERTNIDMTKKLLMIFGLGEDMIEKIDHRKGHDFRYSIKGDKLRALGFQYKHKELDIELQELVKWYRVNQSWWTALKQKRKIKGIILAGGKGTRLFPSTQAICKQLLPIYDKPMIYYPLSTLMLAGIRDILIISTTEDIERFKRLFGDGSQLGIKISYEIQTAPRGLPDAFIVGEKFIGDDNVCLILGDNLFFGRGFNGLLEEATKIENGATIFTYYVKDPERYGIIEFNQDKKVLSIEEKPQNPKSNHAIVGLYFFDNEVIKITKTLKPSVRGELEIIDLIKAYHRKNCLNIKVMGRGFAWLDTGTHESIIDASNFIKTVEDRQALKIGCIEEVAYRKRFISEDQLIKLAQSLKSSSYGKYLLEIPKTKVLETDK